MNKSTMYHDLQILVLNTDYTIPTDKKLEVLRELFKQEDLAKFAEEQEAKQE